MSKGSGELRVLMVECALGGGLLIVLALNEDIQWWWIWRARIVLIEFVSQRKFVSPRQALLFQFASPIHNTIHSKVAYTIPTQLVAYLFGRVRRAALSTAPSCNNEYGVKV